MHNNCRPRITANGQVIAVNGSYISGCRPIRDTAVAASDDSSFRRDGN